MQGREQKIGTGAPCQGPQTMPKSVILFSFNLDTNVREKKGDYKILGHSLFLSSFFSVASLDATLLAMIQIIEYHHFPPTVGLMLEGCGRMGFDP